MRCGNSMHVALRPMLQELGWVLYGVEYAVRFR